MLTMALDWILACLIVIASLGVILTKKPVHACLWFLLTLLSLAATYLQLYAPFISVMQVLVYAGAILVIFMFVIVLFQDAYLAITKYKPESNALWLFFSAAFFVIALAYFGSFIQAGPLEKIPYATGYGSVEALGNALYLDFFFPFEAVGVLFLVAMVGALYIGKKVHVHLG